MKQSTLSLACRPRPSFCGSLLLGVVLFGAASARAGQVTAVLTADNHYGLFYGTDDGSELSFVGRNEMGTFGEPGEFNWNLPETYTFDVPEDQRIYVVAWEEAIGSIPTMWIGQFQLPDGSLLLSDASRWECICGSDLSPEKGDVPPDETLAYDIAAGSFATPFSWGPNGRAPWWGYIPDIPAEARFLWIDNQLFDSLCPTQYVIFRSVNPIAAAPAALFRRGDVDANGTADITDPVVLIGHLFLGEARPPCFDAADTDDSGGLDIADAISLLGHIFLGEAAPPPPGLSACGADATADAPGADFGCVYPAASCQ